MNSQTQSPIDVDERETWPAATRAWLEEHAKRLSGTTEHLCDFSVMPEQEDEFRRTFGTRKLLAYHATRLLPHETDAIRRHGLRLLDEQLIHDRIADAVARAALSARALRAANEGNVYATHNLEGREGKICCVLGRAVFEEDAGGCNALLRSWGGEAIRGGPDDVPALASIGTPSIVVVGLDLTRPHNEPYAWPSLGSLFVGSLLGLARRYSELHYPDAVAGSDVLTIWQPGHAEYDVHAQLPR